MRLLVQFAVPLGFVCGSVCAWGQAGPSVSRGVGAEECPDAAALSRRIDHIRGRTENTERTTYNVRFTRRADGFAAEIRTGEGNGSVRLLKARGATCEALAQATAVTLSLLLDSGVITEVEPPP